jgi:hypothetical protein
MLHDDVPFDFDERLTDPTGRVVRTAQGTVAAPRRKRRDAKEAQADSSLEDLLRKSIREVMEREIRKARTADDLSELLRLSLEDLKRRREVQL